MAKIIEGVIPYSVNGFACYLLKLTCVITKLSKKYIPKNNVYIGYQWKHSWKPLGFDRSVLYD